jgi:hypothetical protein
MYRVLYSDLNNRSIRTSTKANTIEAPIPVTPIGVKKPEKAKNTIKAPMKATIPLYIHAMVFETSGSLIMLNLSTVIIDSFFGIKPYVKCVGISPMDMSLYPVVNLEKKAD